MADPVTTGAGFRAGGALVDKGMSALDGPPESKKDDVDIAYQQLRLLHPELGPNDPAVKKLLRAAISNAGLQGREDVLKRVIPGMFEKVNFKQIDLNGTDGENRMRAELDRVQKYYEGWLTQQQAQSRIDEKASQTNLDVNSIATKTYERGVASWASLARFVTAVVDCCQEGSLDPMRQFIREASAPKHHTIQTTGASAVRPAAENSYVYQAPKIEGSTTVQKAGEALRNEDTNGAFDPKNEGAAEERTSSPKPARRIQIGENARSINGGNTQQNAPAAAANAKHEDGNKPRRITFGVSAPTPEPS